METNSTFNRGLSIAAAVVFSVEMILALIANGMVLLITITQRKSWKQSSTIFFTSLILAHLVMALLCMPFLIIFFADGEWIFGSTDAETQGTYLFLILFYLYTALVIVMTVAALSVDRFLFIVKPHLHKRFMRPWVALTLTIITWILVVPLSIVGFFKTSNSICVLIYVILLSVILLGIIFVTSVWTFCFTCRFINNQSVTAGESAYASRKKRLFGIFGSMLIVYIICFFPIIIYFILDMFIEVPEEYGLVATVCFVFITIANPIVQAYFRPEIKSVLLSRCPLLSAYVCCSCSHAVCEIFI